MQAGVGRISCRAKSLLQYYCYSCYSIVEDVVSFGFPVSVILPFGQVLESLLSPSSLVIFCSVSISTVCFSISTGVLVFLKFSSPSSAVVL